MRRLPLLLAVLAWCALPARAQDQPARQPLDTWTTKKAQTAPAEPLPAQPVPMQQLRGYDPYTAEALGAEADSLSEAQILRRISRVYAYQAEILVAQSNDDAEHAENLLGLAMTDLATLAEQPGIMDRPRFRELYRTVVTEYERFYGVADASLSLPFGDVYALRADIFAMMNEVDQPLLEDVTLPELAPMETQVPMTVNRIVERTIEYFLREKRDVLERWMARSETYLPMIEQIFEEEGVPDELKYLAFVESGLNPRAKSWASAVGMWQFIAATGRAYDLQVNSWVDERM
ncbi:MAG: transglycosylase SLT domain-containing protein, partial [Rhodothermales bacterium]|nr:transglycosylase SLT domain-containing protein [Rhodothermales bacterium]